MGEHTNIEWCDTTVNPTDFQCRGCELWNKTTKDCYAGRFAERRAGIGAFDKPVVLMPGRMAKAALYSDLRGTNRKDKPWLDGRPRVIFLGDMADVLQPGVPFEYLKKEIIDVAWSPAGQRHIWMLLTKQAKRLVQFQEWMDAWCLNGLRWPDNLWPGVSVTSERTTWRIDELLKIRTRHRFISYEPAWEYVDFSRWTCAVEHTDFGKAPCPSEKIELIITGGMSGKGAKEHPFNEDWALDLIDLCEHDQVNCFVKQLGSNAVYTAANRELNPNAANDPKFWVKLAGSKHHPNPITHPKGGDWNEWQPRLRVRQFPEV